MFIKVNYYMLILTENEDAAQIMKMASKYDLVATHKIGIYGTEQQDELYCKGKWFNMWKFTRELNKLRTKK